MEGDREAALTIQSAKEGVIDFSKADILDRMWWKRWMLLLNQVERSNRAAFHQALHLHSIGIAQIAKDSTEINDKLTIARDRMVRLTTILMPWIDLKVPDAKQQVQELQNAWKRRWGDWNDPEVRRRILRKSASILESVTKRRAEQQEKIAKRKRKKKHAR